MNELSRLTCRRRTGSEGFHIDGRGVGFDLLTFWQWSGSDLIGNTARGRLAEYIVARALGLAADGVRDEWAPYDLETRSGIKIEVKSAAYVQSWHQERLSSIKFVTPKKRAWDANTNVLSKETRRQADVYVFALLSHKEKSTIDPLDLGQWHFYVLPTAALDARTRSQHSITLASLQKLTSGAVGYADLLPTVEGYASRAPDNSS